jgi:hypothetical protein
MIAEFPQKTPEIKAVEKLITKLDELSGELKTVKTRFYWGFFFVGFLVIYKLNLWQY